MACHVVELQFASANNFFKIHHIGIIDPEERIFHV